MADKEKDKSPLSRVWGSLDLLWQAFSLIKKYPILFLLFGLEFLLIGVFAYFFYFYSSPLYLIFMDSPYSHLRPLLFFAWVVSFIIVVFNGIGVFCIYRFMGRRRISPWAFLIALPAQVIYSLLIMLLTVSVQLIARAFNKGKFDLTAYLNSFGISAPQALPAGAKAAAALVSGASIGPNITPHNMLLRILYELWSGITYFTNQSILLEGKNFFASVDRSVEITKNCFTEVLTGHIIYSSLLYVYGTVLIIAVTATALVGVMVSVSISQMLDLLKFFSVFWGLLILAFYSYLAQAYFTLVYMWNEDLESARQKNKSATLSNVPMPDVMAEIRSAR